MSDVDARSLEDWIAFARVDAERRGLPELKPLLGGLLDAVRELRAADWNDDFSPNDFSRNGVTPANGPGAASAS